MAPSKGLAGEASRARVPVGLSGKGFRVKSEASWQ